MIERLSALEPEQRALVGQVVRYAAAGLAITLSFAAAYWGLTEATGMDPMLSLTIVFIVWTFISYSVHGRFSFRGHGGRDRPHVRTMRFFVTNLVGYGVNQLFVWMLVHHLGGPTWWPIIPIVLVTPWITFFLQRRWVYA